MKKIIQILIALLLGLSCIYYTSCSNNKKNNNLEEISFLCYFDNNEKQYFDKIIKDFENKYPKIKIKIINTNYYSLKDSLSTLIKNGETPALIRSSENTIPKQDCIDLSSILNSQNYMSILKGYFLFKTKVIALPLQVTANGMIINKDIFDKAGISYPNSPQSIWTWKEFLKKTDKLRKYCKCPGVIDHSVFRWSSLLYEFGGSIFNKKNEVVINNKAGINALNLFINMQKNYIINPNVWLPINSIDANSLFMSGEYGFYIGGSWLLAGYKDLPFQWDVTYMPIGTRRSSTLGCKLIAAVKNSGHEESAKLFIKYISSKKVSDYLCSNTLSISPRIDGADISYPSCSNYISIFRNELLNTPVISVKDWSHPHIDIVNFVLKTAIHQAINGLAPQKALDKAAKTIKTLEDSKYKNISATLAGQSKMKIH